MNCSECNNTMQIFARGGKEIYVCPICLSGLLPDESCAKILKHFCNEQIIDRFISTLLDDSLLDAAGKTLSAGNKVLCPQCGSLMGPFDFDNKIRFYVNKCEHCGCIWLDSIQMPLVSVIFTGDNFEDLNYKNRINNLYKTRAGRRPRKIRSLDEVLAPFAVMSGLLPSIPLGDNILKKRRAYATGGLIIACALVFIWQLAGDWMGAITAFALYPDKVSAGEWHRLITSAFMHGGILHLAGNMLFLRMFGRTLENEMGPGKYLLLYAVGAVVSGIFYMATSADRTIPAVGASGAISAVMGSYLILFPRSQLRFNVLHPFTFHKVASAKISSLYYVLAWIIMNVFFGMLQAGGRAAGIAYWGHIGGFVAGIVFVEAYKTFKRG